MVKWHDEASGAGFVLRLSDYTDRFRISPTNGTKSVEASIIVVNSSLLDVDHGQEYYSFLVCSCSVLVYLSLLSCELCLQCFDTVGWAAGRASGL